MFKDLPNDNYDRLDQKVTPQIKEINVSHEIYVGDLVSPKDSLKVELESSQSGTVCV
jgi:hypothetical protein